MANFARVQAYLEAHHPDLKAIQLDENTATSELAASALGVEVGQIAKSLVFKGKQEYIMVVAPGDVRIATKKIRQMLGGKVRMATAAEVLEITGFPVGGVCPFALKSSIRILLEAGLARYPRVYAAAGTANSVLPVTLTRLQEITKGEIIDLMEA